MILSRAVALLAVVATFAFGCASDPSEVDADGAGEASEDAITASVRTYAAIGKNGSGFKVNGLGGTSARVTKLDFSSDQLEFNDADRARAESIFRADPSTLLVRGKLDSAAFKVDRVYRREWAGNGGGGDLWLVGERKLWYVERYSLQ